MKHWPQHPPLEGIHLWICKGLLAPRLDGVWDLLAPEEQKRARAYRFEHDQRRYLGSALLQRSLLARYTSCSLRELSFSRNQWGKPSLDGDHHKIEFNISRSHEVALLAVSDGSMLGVDVEYAMGCDNGAMPVASQFSEPERSYIETASDSTRALFEIWTRKEAYIKGIGRGLSHPLAEFDVTPNVKTMVSDWSEDPPPEPWRVHSIELSVSGYTAAIATILPSPSIEVIEVTVEEL
jgi:4'-phosphopantetheinyl transferase